MKKTYSGICMSNEQWENFCVDRNLKGLEAEKAGQIDSAISLYEAVVDAKFDGNLPYDRLCIIYRKHGDLQKEYDVLQKAISVFSKLSNTSPREDVKPKLVKFKERKEKLLKLASKKGIHINV